MSILVTGGRGTLGRIVVAKLRGSGREVRVLSRSSGSGLFTGNLLTGVGLDGALNGVDVVVHCATGRNDVRATRNLVASARTAGTQHLVYISIVGVDRIPFFYYRAKFAAERLVEGSGLPFTILRATQFHTLVDGLFSAQRRLPVLFAPSFSLQPIDVAEVAERLVALAGADAAGRVADIGGPQIRSARDLAVAWLTVRRPSGRSRRIWSIRLPGKIFRALRSGPNLTPAHADGRITFEQYLKEHP